MKKILLLLISFIILFPTILVLIYSFYNNVRYPVLFPENYTLDFWNDTVFFSPRFYKSILNSIIIGFSTGILATIIGIMTARAIVRYDFFGSKFVKVIFSLPLFIPAIALFMGVHLMMIKLHLINSYPGVVLGHVLISIPYATSIFISFFNGINKDMENVAKTLGCRQPRLYMKILIPLISPGIYLAFSISFLIYFSEYFSTFLIGGGRIITLSSMMYPYISNGDRSNAATLGVVFILVNISVFFLADLLSRKKNKVESYLFD